jgi:hypothetical protein
MTAAPRNITIFGTSKAAPDDKVYKDAFELGRLLAQNGLAIVNGGYGGTMLAAAQGARTASGAVIGVTCSAFGRKGPNQYVTREIRTENLDQRLKTLIDLGSAYCVLPGSTGTLLELAQVWELKNKGFTPSDKPVIIVGDFWADLIALMEKADPKCLTCLTLVDTPLQAVEILTRCL